MVVAGVLMLGLLPRGGLVQVRLPGRFSKSVGKLLMSQAPASKFYLGLGLGFLPCGLLYAALLKAMSAGTALAGAASMLAFGLGTAGALVGLGAFSTAITSRLGRWSNVLAAAGVILVGAILMWKGYAAQPHRMLGHVHHGHS